MAVAAHGSEFTFFEDMPEDYAIDRRLLKRIQPRGDTDQCLEYIIEGQLYTYIYK